MNDRLRVVGTLVGDIQRQPDMRTKYGGFFESVAARFDLLEVFDASLSGAAKYINAFQTFSPSMTHWKARYFKNVRAFQTRSSRARKHMQAYLGKADVILQVGATFDGTVEYNTLPLVLYTDNTTSISARHPDPVRHPFSPRELKDWVRLETLFYRNTAHICVRANNVKVSLMDDYGIPGDRITIIGGGVNTPLQSRIHDSDPSAPFTVLFIGLDFHRKGGDLVLQAFARLRQSHNDTRLLLLTQDAVPPGLPLAGVQVIPPTWDREQIEDLYLQADVFVLPSRMETWGDVLLEAMSFGLPCVGVKGQAMEDIIVEERTGFLAAPGDASAIADALILLYENRELRRAMGQAARRRVADEFTWDRVVERLSPILLAVSRQNPVSDRHSSLERISI